jgi:transcriptional regulator with XRE-family HTH domain
VPNLSLHRQHPALLAIGKVIRNARISKGITQERLAFIAEVDRSYLGRVERGDNNVALLTLLKIAQALDLSMAELLNTAEL